MFLNKKKNQEANDKNSKIVAPKVTLKSKSKNKSRSKSRTMSHTPSQNFDANSTHQLYKKCLETQKEKEEKHQEKLRLHNRVEMLKKELARAFRQKAREDRKREHLEMIHREQLETKKRLEDAKQKKEKQLEKKRQVFAKRNSVNEQRLKVRKSKNLEYKKALAQNVRFQSKIREKVAKKHAEKEYYRNKEIHDEVRASERDVSHRKTAHIQKLMEQLAKEYEERLARDQNDINKEEQDIEHLNEEVQVLAAMINEMNTTGKLPDGADVSIDSKY